MTKITLSFTLLLILSYCKQVNKNSNKKMNILDTVYLTNPNKDKSYKPVVITLNSNDSNEPVNFDLFEEDTIKISINGMARDYPILIKNSNNILLKKISDDTFYMKVLNKPIYFEIWQNYGVNKVICKVMNSNGSIKYIPYEGEKPVGRIIR